MAESCRSREPVHDLPRGAGSRLAGPRDDAAGLSIAREFDARPDARLHLVFHSALAHRRGSLLSQSSADDQ